MIADVCAGDRSILFFFLEDCAPLANWIPQGYLALVHWIQIVTGEEGELKLDSWIS